MSFLARVAVALHSCCVPSTMLAARKEFQLESIFILAVRYGVHLVLRASRLPNGYADQPMTRPMSCHSTSGAGNGADGRGLHGVFAHRGLSQIEHMAHAGHQGACT